MTSAKLCIWATTLLAAAGSLACAKDADRTDAAKPDPVKRGEYLVRFGGCNDCHTPWKLDPASGAPAPDMSRMLSGHPEAAPDPQGTYQPADIAVIGPTFTSFRMPFGVVYAANLTPDENTGLGAWSDAQFVAAMRTGRHMGAGRVILPPMPWQAANALSDDDLRAVHSYLRSIPAIANRVPAPKVPAEVIAKMEQGAKAAAKKARN